MIWYHFRTPNTIKSTVKCKYTHCFLPIGPIFTVDILDYLSDIWVKWLDRFLLGTNMMLKHTCPFILIIPRMVSFFSMNLSVMFIVIFPHPCDSQFKGSIHLENKPNRKGNPLSHLPGVKRSSCIYATSFWDNHLWDLRLVNRLLSVLHFKK